MMHRLKNLVKIANQLDQKGLVKEADLIDSIILKLAEKSDEDLFSDGPNPDDYLFYDDGSEDEDIEDTIEYNDTMKDEDEDEDDLYLDYLANQFEEDDDARRSLEDSLEAGPRG
jgi:hypothetical protein